MKWTKKKYKITIYKYLKKKILYYIKKNANKI